MNANEQQNRFGLINERMFSNEQVTHACLTEIDSTNERHIATAHTLDHLSAISGLLNEDNEPEELTPREFKRWTEQKGIWKSLYFVGDNVEDITKGFVNTYKTEKRLLEQLEKERFIQKKDVPEEINYFTVDGRLDESALGQAIAKRFAKGVTAVIYWADQDEYGEVAVDEKAMLGKLGFKEAISAKYDTDDDQESMSFILRSPCYTD